MPVPGWELWSAPADDRFATRGIVSSFLLPAEPVKDKKARVILMCGMLDTET